MWNWSSWATKATSKRKCKQSPLTPSVTTQKALDYAAGRKMTHLEVSAKTSDQVTKAFVQLSKKLMAKKDSKDPAKNK